MQHKLKRFLDILISILGFIILSPLFGLISLIIKLDDKGSILFKQERLGKNGKIFKLYKFRTMKVDTPVKFNADGSTRVEKNDPRVTKAGKILRCGLDELPQLWNVFKGEMSLVGPRPDEPIHFQYYTPEEKKKLSVLPGITGLAMIKGRNDIPWKERVAWDIEYIQKFSLFLDFKIILKTIWIISRGSGVYYR